MTNAKLPDGFAPIRVGDEIVGGYKIVDHVNGALAAISNPEQRIEAVLKRVAEKYDADKSDATWLLQESLSDKPIYGIEMVTLPKDKLKEAKVTLQVSERGTKVEGDARDVKGSWHGVHFTKAGLIEVANQAVRSYFETIPEQRQTFRDTPELGENMFRAMVDNLPQPEKCMMYFGD